MDKLFLPLIIISLLLGSCSSSSTTPTDPEKGQIILNMAAPDGYQLSDFTVKYTGPGGSKTIAWPANNTIAELEEGTYTVSVTTHPNGYPAPAFNAGVYEGSVSGLAIVNGNKTTANITCSNVYGGVYFKYDESLEGLNIKQTVAGANGSLVYENLTEEVGYFEPGNAAVTISLNGEPAIINGGEDKIYFEILEGMDYEVALSDVSIAPGGLTIGVTFREKPKGTDVVLDTYTELTNVVQAIYYGDSASGNSTKFGVIIKNAENEGLSLEGYTSKQNFSGFSLAAGTYNVSSSTAAMNIIAGSESGGEILPTIGAVWTDNTTSEVWFAQEGTLKVSHEGTNTVLEFKFSGKRKGNSTGGQEVVFSNKIYKFSGALSWLDASEQGVPTAIEWANAPTGVNYVMTGADQLFNDGPNSITGTITKQESPRKRLSLSHWGNNYGEVFDMYPLYLNYDETAKAFYLDVTTALPGEDLYGPLTAYWVGAYLLEGETTANIVPEDHRLWVEVKDNKIDFGYNSYMSADVYIGLVAYLDGDVVYPVSAYYSGVADFQTTRAMTAVPSYKPLHERVKADRPVFAPRPGRIRAIK